MIIPILAGAFGNFLIPLMIGADDMAFPTLNMLSYWFMWPAFICIGCSFFGPPVVWRRDSRRSSGWTSYPPLSLPGGVRQTLWLLGITFVGVSSMMGSVNYMTTIIQMRAPGHDDVPPADDDLGDVHHRDPAGVRAAGAHGGGLHAALGSAVRHRLLPAGGLVVNNSAHGVRAAASRCCGSTCSGSTRTRPCTS